MTSFDPLFPDFEPYSSYNDYTDNVPIEPIEIPSMPNRAACEAATKSRAIVEESLSLDGPPDTYVTVDGRTYLYFAGSGYFGLQSHPEVLTATCEATLRYGLGTATSRSSFTSPPVFEVERRGAAIFGVERSFYTSSGYMANQILVDALTGSFDRVFIDEASHYSLFDAARGFRELRLRPVLFQHRNVDDLHKKLDENLQWNQRPLVLTDGLFSALGTLAPIDKYVELLSQYEGSSLLIDDAHGLGVLGKNGLGTLEHFGFTPSIVNRTSQDEGNDLSYAQIETPSVALYSSFTMSKAVGGYGGMLPGSERFIEHLTERSKIFIGASAPPNPVAAATAKGLAVLFDDDVLRSSLRQNSRLLKHGLTSIGLSAGEQSIPIATLTIGSSGNMRRIQNELSRRSILVSYMPRNPGIGSEGAIRIAVFATHTPEMITTLIDALKEIL
ncbi:MAG: pyridoxal phosphate-dependent aminotransferase family protein [Planctomycetaceae bacterium]|jgi:7-keto-8-aminopelargonate synthetase-like enzyme|nr:pyridoxal phosphate-dependent aminotransferase family protein [Planctomycetaceae bacterium]